MPSKRAKLNKIPHWFIGKEKVIGHLEMAENALDGAKKGKIIFAHTKMRVSRPSGDFADPYDECARPKRPQGRTKLRHIEF